MKKIVALSIAVACTACSALDQAPLVYSSKTSVGIDVSGTSTENLGLSVSVGFKQVDAAYVPVAVAKPCDNDNKDKNNKCNNKEYEIVKLTGTSSETSDSNPNQAKDIENFLYTFSKTAYDQIKKSPI